MCSGLCSFIIIKWVLTLFRQRLWRMTPTVITSQWCTFWSQSRSPLQRTIPTTFTHVLKLCKKKKERKCLSFYWLLYIWRSLCRQRTAMEEKHCVEVKRTKPGAFISAHKQRDEGLFYMSQRSAKMTWIRVMYVLGDGLVVLHASLPTKLLWHHLSKPPSLFRPTFIYVSGRDSTSTRCWI